MSEPSKTKPACVAVVDDSRSLALYITSLLKSLGYATQMFTDSRNALEELPRDVPDLILMDLEMPELNGYELCSRLKLLPQFQDIPIIFVSTVTDKTVMVKGFSIGARDYIIKPFSTEELAARVKTHLELSALQRQQKEMNRTLRQLVAEQVEEISSAQLGTITALATLAEHRDEDTGAHLFRVAEYCQVLGSELMVRKKYDVTPEFVQIVTRASPLHDIGKVAIPDAILLKAGRLTPDEFEIMKTHTTVGAQTLTSVIGADAHNRYLTIGADIAIAHHEKWDGSGYPYGLAGENIPLSGRMMAVADVYDALRSKRCYKPEFPHKKASEFILAGIGTHFDPLLGEIFIQKEEEFNRIWDKFIQ